MSKGVTSQTWTSSSSFERTDGIQVYVKHSNTNLSQLLLNEFSGFSPISFSPIFTYPSASHRSTGREKSLCFGYHKKLLTGQEYPGKCS
ncbi:hypothetical protein NPIL_472141 [Nephila pilipes]|uniref:Uncharacterized protein n=1 Tax=Nephila pilipes TaxID=299642 RepID=A0A8X6N2L1_NEPPI|nr:hypothetical protein NPIL_472141 [Nephila pilipes]